MNKPNNPSSASKTGTGRLLTLWTPEDKEFWETQGKVIANQNLWLSIPALFLAFAVWMVWSAVVTQLPLVGFKFTPDQLFWLTALPALSGATLRIFYSFAVTIVGGRRWTVLSTLSLLIPLIGMSIAVQDINTPYWVMVLLAILCGFGGGNFSSSMANISFFFPKARKGSALGLNAGLGNLGVSSVQFLVPLVISLGIFGIFGGEPQTIHLKDGSVREIWLQNAALVWIAPVILSALMAFLMMNDIADAKSSFSEQSHIFRSSHTWLMCWLYIGTFGSFIGFSAGFPLLIKSQFPTINPLQYAWIGPFLGALIRPVGGWLSDKIGGAQVTFWNFIVMVIGVIGVLYFLPNVGKSGDFSGFFMSFMLLFISAGIGNGSTFRMIPVIFMEQSVAEATRQGQTADHGQKEGGRMGAAALGFIGAIGAYGGFFIPMSYGLSINYTGTPHTALALFIAFYVSCIVITWWCYARPDAKQPC